MYADEKSINYQNLSFVHLSFEQDIETTEYYYPEFSFPTFLSDVGGTLGLWLGVGVVQLGEYGATLLGHVKAKFKAKVLF